ncbi:MAG: hypothetical protein K2J85_07270, partial [Anaeroplasmataceae bacterium]|nr:hypothetical protein [Anaeroplasmataceae bacterium]
DYSCEIELYAHLEDTNGFTYQKTNAFEMKKSITKDYIHNYVNSDFSITGGVYAYSEIAKYDGTNFYYEINKRDKSPNPSAFVNPNELKHISFGCTEVEELSLDIFLCLNDPWLRMETFLKHPEFERSFTVERYIEAYHWIFYLYSDYGGVEEIGFDESYQINYIRRMGFEKNNAYYRFELERCEERSIDVPSEYEKDFTMFGTYNTFCIGDYIDTYGVLK